MDCTQNYQARVNSVDFHRSEDLLVTAGDDDAIRLYNTQSGMEIKHVLSKKHGVCNLCYTHAPQAVIHASNKVGRDSAAYQCHPEEVSVFKPETSQPHWHAGA